MKLEKTFHDEIQQILKLSCLVISDSLDRESVLAVKNFQATSLWSWIHFVLYLFFRKFMRKMPL